MPLCRAGVAGYCCREGADGARESRSLTGHTKTEVVLKIQSGVTSIRVLYNKDTVSMMLHNGIRWLLVLEPYNRVAAVLLFVVCMRCLSLS